MRVVGVCGCDEPSCLVCSTRPLQLDDPSDPRNGRFNCAGRYVMPSQRGHYDIPAARGQSKRDSLAEAVVNTVVGFVIANLSLAVICWFTSIPLSWHDNFVITFWMTFISITRSYIIRRIWNRRSS